MFLLKVLIWQRKIRSARKEDNGKRGIIVTLAELMRGEVLSMKLIYKAKRKRSLPVVEFPAGFVLIYNKKKHRNNGTKTLTLIQNIIYLYIKDVNKIGA